MAEKTRLVSLIGRPDVRHMLTGVGAFVVGTAGLAGRLTNRAVVIVLAVAFVVFGESAHEAERGESRRVMRAKSRALRVSQDIAMMFVILVAGAAMYFARSGVRLADDIDLFGFIAYPPFVMNGLQHLMTAMFCRGGQAGVI